MSHGACKTEAEMFSVAMCQTVVRRRPVLSLLPWSSHPEGLLLSGPLSPLLPPAVASPCARFLQCLWLQRKPLHDFPVPSYELFYFRGRGVWGQGHFVKDETSRKQDWVPSCWLSPNLEKGKEERREGSKMEGQSGTLRSPPLDTGAHSRRLLTFTSRRSRAGL